MGKLKLKNKNTEMLVCWSYPVYNLKLFVISHCSNRSAYDHE